MPYVEADGGRIFYADDGDGTPGRAHSTVFMQPWLFGDHTRFSAWVPAFASEFRVIRMDRRSLGRSDPAPPGGGRTIGATVEDFVGLLDALELERVHFIGESTGGVLGVALAARYPHRVASLVLCATPVALAPVAASLAVPPYPDAATSVRAMGSAAYAEALLARATNSVEKGSSTWHEEHRRFGRVGTFDAEGLAMIVEQFVMSGVDITELLGAVEAPTLLLSPGASALTRTSDQSSIARAIPRCEQVVFEGAAHTIFAAEQTRCIGEALRFVRSAFAGG